VLFHRTGCAIATADTWTLAGRSFWCVVFPNVAPGEAWVSWLDQSRTEEARFLVEAGKVARLDWRRGRVR
jgi:hypothetical protein